jgi:hypothetical protein
LINFIKLSSLIIILLFFPISININSNLNISSKVPEISQAIILPTLEEDGLYAIATIFTQWNVTNIDWGNVKRNENAFLMNVKIEFGERIYSELEFKAIRLEHKYKIGDIDIGEYSLKLYINGYDYGIINFTINPPPIPYEEFKELSEIERNYLKAENFWSGKEWIMEVSLFLNFAPQKIDWGEVRYIGKDYIKIGDCEKTIYIKGINITLNGKWLKVKDIEVWYPYKHNYTLGLLPKGQISIEITINNFQDISLSYNFDSEFYIRTITSRYTATLTYIITGNGKTETLKLPYEDFKEETIVSTITIFATYKEETSEIIESPTSTFETTILKESPETTILETRTTKTIQTFKEIEKEEFKIEQYNIPIFLFIIVIIVTLFLYYILFKRREI